jgi:hypothetical protein
VTARALIAGAVLALAAALFAFRVTSKMPDFEVYWRAGGRALAAEPLYRIEDEHYQLKYLPAFAMLAIPLSLIPLPAAKTLWLVASAGLIGVLLAVSGALLPSRRKPPGILLAITVAVMAKFYGHELVLGQVNLLLAVSVLAAVQLLGRHEAGAGLLIALAVVIKPYAVVFVPWLGALRAWRPLASALAGIGAALVVPALVYGVEGTIALHRDWWTTVTSSTAPNLLNPDNVSLAAMYAKWIGPGDRARMLAAVSTLGLLGVAAAVFAARRPVTAPEGLEAALLLTLMPLLSPQGWDYVFLVSTPAVMYAINYDRELPRPIRALTWGALGTIGFSIYDLMGRRAYGVFMALSVISVCYLILIGTLLTLRLRRTA